MKVNRIKFKIIVSILIIIALVPIVIIGTDHISNAIKISKTRNALEQLYAKELETKIIDKLKTTKINVNTSTIKTTFEKYQYVDDDIFKLCTYNNKSSNIYKDFICMFITENNKGIAIPLFKIESYSNGKFKTIEFLDGSEWFWKPIVGDTIQQIIKSECNIENSYFYCNEFYGASRKPKVLGKEMQLMYKDRDFAADILADIIVSGDNHYSSTEEIRIMTYTRLSDMKERSVIWGLFD